MSTTVQFFFSNMKIVGVDHLIAYKKNSIAYFVVYGIHNNKKNKKSEIARLVVR